MSHPTAKPSTPPCQCGDTYCSDTFGKATQGQDRSGCCQYCGYFSCDVCGWTDPGRPILCRDCGSRLSPVDAECNTCRYWTNMLAASGALIIDGSLYFVGDEPDPADLARNPKLYGCYGTGFTIGHADGTQTITHNLGCCGKIPARLRPADNAAFLGEPVRTPAPAVPAHDHMQHLDYIGGQYPYECVVCNGRFTASDIPPAIADQVALDLFGGAA